MVKKELELTNQIRDKLRFLIENVDKLDFKDNNIIPLLNVYEWEDYSWQADFVGITKDGKIGYVFDSGCSCNEPDWDAEENEIPSSCENTTIKGLELELKDYSDWMHIFDLEKLESNLDELIKSIKK